MASPPRASEWNSHQQDLLAVSYGDTRATSYKKMQERRGLILFWSLKNPTYPARSIATKSDVTCLNFSQQHPNMIAAGMLDGHVGVWDLRQASDAPVLQSGMSHSAQGDRKHTDAVTEVMWTRDRSAQ